MGRGETETGIGWLYGRKALARLKLRSTNRQRVRDEQQMNGTLVYNELG